MTIKVRETKLKGNQVSVMLDIHRNGKRIQKSTKIRYCLVPKTALERQDKKEKLEVIRKMVSSLESNAMYEDYFLERKHQLNKDFFEYSEEFMSSKAPSQAESYISAVKQLKKFTKKNRLSCSEIDAAFLVRFRNHLEKELSGISPYNYFKKIKKIIKEATYCKYFVVNPTERIINPKGICGEKETLTTQEIQILVNTDCTNVEVKKAFLFSYLTGLRYSDVSKLKWGDIQNGLIDIIQQKTQERLTINLHVEGFNIIGTPKASKDLLFELPSYENCLIHLKNWVVNAEINKHITWHCSRHSFATTLILNNENVMTVSKLLGHKSIIETQRYIRVAEMSKVKAINSIPSIYKS